MTAAPGHPVGKVGLRVGIRDHLRLGHEQAALAMGFLFFVVTVGLAIPGAIILAAENLRVRESNPQA